MLPIVPDSAIVVMVFDNIKKKTWELSCCPSHELRLSHCPELLNEQHAIAHADMNTVSPFIKGYIPYTHPEDICCCYVRDNS